MFILFIAIHTLKIAQLTHSLHSRFIIVKMFKSFSRFPNASDIFHHKIEQYPFPCLRLINVTVIFIAYITHCSHYHQTCIGFGLYKWIVSINTGYPWTSTMNIKWLIMYIPEFIPRAYYVFLLYIYIVYCVSNLYNHPFNMYVYI